jgi:ABC-type maltose transport system permease subunit
MVDDTAPGASIPVLVLYFVFQQQFIAGLTAGGLKH